MYWKNLRLGLLILLTIFFVSGCSSLAMNSQGYDSGQKSWVERVWGIGEGGGDAY